MASSGLRLGSTPNSKLLDVLGPAAASHRILPEYLRYDRLRVLATKSGHLKVNVFPEAQSEGAYKTQLMNEFFLKRRR